MCTQCGWLWQHCKCIIPPAEELYNLVANVFHVYGPLKDAQSFLPLFNSAAWSVAKNILELVQKGFLSDPPGVALYYQVGVDGKTGLPLYHCMRGTNMTEGGVHTHLRSRLPTSGVSPRHVQCCLLDFNLRHNLIVRSWWHNMLSWNWNYYTGWYIQQHWPTFYRTLQYLAYKSAAGNALPRSAHAYWSLSDDWLGQWEFISRDRGGCRYSSHSWWTLFEI